MWNDNRMRFLQNNLFTCTPDVTILVCFKSQGLMVPSLLCTEIHNTLKLSTGRCRITILKFCIDIVTCKPLWLGSITTPLQGCGWVTWMNRKQTFLVYWVLQWLNLKSNVSHLNQTSAVFKIKCSLKLDLCCILKTLYKSRHSRELTPLLKGLYLYVGSIHLLSL